MSLRLDVPSNLEEHDADLPGRRIELVEFLRGLDQRAFDVVTGLAVRDADDVDGLRAVGVCFVFAEIGFEDLIQALTSRSATGWAHGLEDFADSAGS